MKAREFPVRAVRCPAFFLTSVFSRVKDGMMRKRILAVCFGLAGIWGIQAGEIPSSDSEKTDGPDGKSLPSGELLSDHVAEAKFTGVIRRQCMLRTALCPDKCDHAKDFAAFRIIKYLDYRKPGKYGDEKQENLMIDVNPAHKPILQGAGILKKIAALKPGDKVVLHWSHYYMRRDSGSFPERPVISIRPLPSSEAKAED